MSGYPARPVDIGHDTPIQVLADRYSDHRSRLYRHRHGTEPLGPDDFAFHALAALAYGTELTERAAAGRWCHAVDALSAGATHLAVAQAMGIPTPEDMRIGLAVWASEQHHHGFMSHERRERIRELIGEEA